MPYQALDEASRHAVFIILPVADHGGWNRMMRDSALGAGATRRSTAAAGCTVENPKPYGPNWDAVIELLDRYLQ